LQINKGRQVQKDGFFEYPAWHEPSPTQRGIQKFFLKILNSFVWTKFFKDDFGNFFSKTLSNLRREEGLTPKTPS
jgi:hypothetical protein